MSFVKHKLIENRHITNETFVMQMERKNIEFVAGQNIVVGIDGDFNTRDYSIYSSEKSDFIEVLVREIKDGYLSPKLKKLKPGSLLDVYGPFGHFNLDEDKMYNHHIYMISSGTGIAPFHSMISSYDDINYTLIHGVKYHYEAYERDHFDENRYILCTSRDNKGNFAGRVTDYLRTIKLLNDSIYYVCGNNNMIHDVISVLNQKGIKREQIYLEIYF